MRMRQMRVAERREREREGGSLQSIQGLQGPSLSLRNQLSLCETGERCKLLNWKGESEAEMRPPVWPETVAVHTGLVFSKRSLAGPRHSQTEQSSNSRNKFHQIKAQ